MADNPVLPVTVSATATVINNACGYHGFVFRETGGAAATITLTDGASGPILDVIPLGASEGAADFYERGITVRTSLYATVDGTIEGTVRVT